MVINTVASSKKRTLWGLLIGINNYASPKIQNLDACESDVKKVEAYLRNNYNEELYSLSIKRLITGEEEGPTRVNIIEAIKAYRDCASSEDTLLIYYSGHGSRETAHPYFEESTRKLRALVPSDARVLKNGRVVQSILDKELRYLFWSLEQTTGVKIVYVQDACHATASTRTTATLSDLTDVGEHWVKGKAKYTPNKESQLHIEMQNMTKEELATTFTGFDTEAVTKLQQGFIQREKGAFQRDFPLANHIHLAACQQAQYAYEVTNNKNEKEGLFTQTFLRVLQESEHQITYRDLIQRIRLQIDGAFDQEPSMFIANPNEFYEQEIFLGQALKGGRLSKRSIDIFDLLVPLEQNARMRYKIPLGTLQMLYPLSKNLPRIPVEVVEPLSRPKGVPNAWITTVQTDESEVELQRNIQLSTNRGLRAYINPKYLRKKRLKVQVVAKGEQVLSSYFIKHPALKGMAKFKRSFGPKFHFVPYLKRSTADYSIVVERAYLCLRNQLGELLLTVVRGGEDGPIIFQRRGQKIWLQLEQTSNWLNAKEEQSPLLPAKTALNLGELAKVLIRELHLIFLETLPEGERNKPIPQSSLEKGLIIAVDKSVALPSTLENHKRERAASFTYFNNFIEWTNEQADYCLEEEQGSYVLYSYLSNGQRGSVPLFKPFHGLSLQSAYNTVNALQKISKWQSVYLLHNLAQSTLFQSYRMGLRLGIPQGQKDGIHQLDIDLTKAESFEDRKAGILKSPFPNPLTWNKANFQGEVFFEMDMDIFYFSGERPLYIGALLLDANFGISPLGDQTICSEVEPNQQYSFKAIQWKFAKQLNHYQELNNCRFYIKLFIALQPFTLSSLMQDALPAPEGKAQVSRASILSLDKQRGKKIGLQDFEKSMWKSYTIPLLMGRNSKIINP